MKGLAKGALGLGLILLCQAAQAQLSMDAQLNYELSAYANDAADRNISQRLNNSLSFEAEFYQEFSGDHSITFKPFYRFDEMDEERSHGDIRELMWHQVADDYELKVGVGKVFWGVTESAHLVDIVNQTDAVESLDGEEKLGQPMVQLLVERDWGNLDLFLLPYHRECTFSGPEGRLSTGFTFAEALYESSNEERNIDVAARFYSYLDDFEYAVSFFHGTSREPSLGADLVSGRALAYYPIISQLGLELQYLNEGWAWKLESIYREGMLANSLSIPNVGQFALVDSGGLQLAQSKGYFASAAGFEYTQVGIFDSRMDLGWVAEHLYDSRQEDANFGVAEHDVLIATRWVSNDEADSEFLAGVLIDYEYEDYSLSLEGNTRLMDGLSFEIEARLFAPQQDNPQYGFRDEDFLRLSLTYYL